MELYHGSHGEHVLAYKKHIERVVNDAISEFPRTMALRVDVHYPPILDRGDTVCCFPKEGANKQVISSQADSLIKISRIWADFFPANTSNQPI